MKEEITRYDCCCWYDGDTTICGGDIKNVDLLHACHCGKKICDRCHEYLKKEMDPRAVVCCGYCGSILAHGIEYSMKVLVAGSRTLNTQTDDLFQILDKVHTKRKITLIISGGAEGPDKISIEWAKSRNIAYELFLPNWKLHGRGAGLIRNTSMVDICDYAVVMWDGESKGTFDTIKKLQKKFDRRWYFAVRPLK